MTEGTLIEVIGEVVETVPPMHVESLAEAIARYPCFEQGAVQAVVNAVPVPGVAHHAARLMGAWKGWAEVPGVAVALALRAASLAAAAERERQRVEVVWTGPTTGEVPVRLTRQVLLEVIQDAQHELWIVSFAAYRVEEIVAALKAVAARGVRVRLVLEQDEETGGTLTFAAADAFEELSGAVSFLAWPQEKRPQLEKGRAALHAKAAVADERIAFVTSANLTGHALSRNMELGLLVRGGSVPRQLSAHFRQLVAQGILAEIV
jgi:phosphatidylserine/phosphatidylglycerophosphate/cardiolipin synthase-like enzyme